MSIMLFLCQFGSLSWKLLSIWIIFSHVGIKEAAKGQRSRTGSTRSDNGLCNVTTSGEAYSDDLYKPAILRPMSPGTDVASFYCTYTFKGAPGQRVSFHLKKLRVGEFDTYHKKCRWGFLRLWDGTREPGLYRYLPNILCGDYNSGEIDLEKFSTEPSAEIEFYSEKIHRRDTFTLTYKYVNIELESEDYPKQVVHHMQLLSSSGNVCHWSILVEECENFCNILSPGYPGIYPPSMECHYHVYSQDPMTALQLKFNGKSDKPREFNLRKSEHCEDDFLEIYDGNSSKSAMIGRYCGDDDIPDITTSGSHLFMVFSSGVDLPPYENYGFHATVLTITKEWHQDGVKIEKSVCDWIFNATQGSVSSPDHWLPHYTMCTYTFVTFPEHYLDAMLTIYGLRKDCTDHIEIYQSSKLIAKICDRHLDSEQQLFQFNLTGRQSVVKFYTKKGQGQSTSEYGFWLAFRQVLSPVIQGDEYRDDTARRMVELTSKSQMINYNRIIIFSAFILSLLAIKNYS